MAVAFSPETVFTVPEREGKVGRSRKRLRPDREPESITAPIARLGAKAAHTVTFREGPDGKPMTSRFIFTRVRTLTKWGIGAHPPAAGGMANRRMARRPRAAHRLLAIQPPGQHRARTTRPAGPAAMEDRTRLQAAQGRARPGPLRRPLLAGLVSPHRDGHRRSRVPHARTAAPFSPRGQPNTPEGRSADTADLQVLDRPLPNLQPAHRARSTPAPST
jgi:hypothetical protein